MVSISCGKAMFLMLIKKMKVGRFLCSPAWGYHFMGLHSSYELKSCEILLITPVAIKVANDTNLVIYGYEYLKRYATARNNPKISKLIYQLYYDNL